MAKPVPIYQIKITLRDSHPPIWRRLLVASDITLFQLHAAIQAAMNWEDAHLHQFIIDEVYYTVPYEDDWFDGLRALDERRVKLRQAAPYEQFKFVYEYDFGDSWEHQILVEKILPPNPDQVLPVCIKGKRACPPEDVGGVWGYSIFLDALNDPEHPDHELYTDWIGDEPFDPEAFDLDTINRRLRDLR